MAFYSKFIALVLLLLLGASTLGEAAVIPLPITDLSSSEPVSSPSNLAAPFPVKASAPEAVITGVTHTEERRKDKSPAKGKSDFEEVLDHIAEGIDGAFGTKPLGTKAKRAEEIVAVQPDKISRAERLTEPEEEILEEIDEEEEELLDAIDDIFDKRADGEEDEEEDEEAEDGISEIIADVEEEVLGEVLEEGSEILNDIFDK